MCAIRRRSIASGSWIHSTVRLLFAYHRTNRQAVQGTIAVGLEKHAPFLPDAVRAGSGGAPVPSRYLVGGRDPAIGRRRADVPLRQSPLSRPVVRQAAAAGMDLSGMGRARRFPAASGWSALRAARLLDR